MATYTLQNGTGGLRSEVIDKIIKNYAEPSYIFKTAVSVNSTGGWKNTYYQENPAVLTSPYTNAGVGISPGANFPTLNAKFSKVSGWISKNGFEANITWEDILSDDIDIQTRTLFKLTQKVVNTTDTIIWNGLTENRSPVNINSFTLTDKYQWDLASAAIIDDLLQAKQKLAEANYDVGDLIAFLSPKDYRSLLNYLAGKGAQFPTLGNEVATNGNAGQLAGIQIKVSNNVTASYALVVKPNVCATWKELVPLQSTTVNDPYKTTLIRVVEEGMLQLTDPLAVCLIIDTQN